MPFTLPMSAVWLALAIVFAIIEAATVALTATWFAVGALGAMICALCGGPLWLQIAIFLILAALTLWFTRRFAKELFNRDRQHTNADRIVGMEGLVTETIDNERAVGQIRVAGQIWTARSVGGEVIPIDTRVTVKAISGVKAMVEPLQ